jgi:VWFA-related protein
MRQSLQRVLARGPGRKLLPWVTLTIWFLSTGSGAAPQNPNSPEIQAHEGPTQETEPTFHLNAERNLVTVRVVVRDSKDRAVGNLRREDFRLFDDGKLQEISGFKVETAPPNRVTEAVPSARTDKTPGATHAPAKALAQRFIVLYFDDNHLRPEGMVRTRKAAWHYATTAVRPQDRVAICTGTGTNQVDFTDDRKKLHDTLFPLTTRPPEWCPRPTWVEMQAQSSLQGIEMAIRRLANMPGQRTLVLVSPGFFTETQLDKIDALTDSALRQDVVISAIDALGLPAQMMSGGNPARPDLEMRISLRENAQTVASEGVLASLSTGTGGVFFHNSDDFDDGFRQAAAVPEAYYVLTFSPADIKLDGNFHALRVTVNRHESLTVQARRGYFASATALAAQASNQEEMAKVVYSQEEFHGLPADVNAHVAPLSDRESKLTVIIHVDIGLLPFRREADRYVDKLIFHTALFDCDGKYLTAKDASLDLHLKDATFAKFFHSGLNASTNFPVSPGTYLVREIVRDTDSNETSALNCVVEVPGQ